MIRGILALIIVALAGIAIGIGSMRGGKDAFEPMFIAAGSADARIGSVVPCIGIIEILNGNGDRDAAQLVARLLRGNSFDVKTIDNAPSWDYKSTMVVSRVKDMAIARQIAKIINTQKVMCIRTERPAYDVTVFVGDDIFNIIDRKKGAQ